MVGDETFKLFGDKAVFALEVKLLPDPDDTAVPFESAGSWGAWRLWVANMNLCDFHFDGASGSVDVAEVRWFLAPLFRWVVTNWQALLHEARLPPGGRAGNARPRWSRLAYLAMLESAGDDIERFASWQNWAMRHAIRTAAEGGIVPDVFFQRIGDDIEVCWGDRLQPGTQSITFLAEDGVCRVPVDRMANTLMSATRWFLQQNPVKTSSWGNAIIENWDDIDGKAVGEAAVAWYLDSMPRPGPLTKTLARALQGRNQSMPSPNQAWWGELSPEVAMFGDLSPNISDQAATIMLAEYFNARTNTDDAPNLTELVAEEPAWATTSPWDNGYSLALDVLEAADPDASAPATQIDTMLANFNVRVKDVDLGQDGPRGVALAGKGLHSTILVNRENQRNHQRGRRFTLAHELCHILFDRNRARALTHSSTPWASPSVEQRANAFAAMLLMPPVRAKRPAASSLAGLKLPVERLADRLQVSRTTLKQHLANIGEITPQERDYLLGNQVSIYE